MHPLDRITFEIWIGGLDLIIASVKANIGTLKSFAPLDSDDEEDDLNPWPTIQELVYLLDILRKIRKQANKSPVGS